MPSLDVVKNIIARNYMLPTAKRMGTNIVGVGLATKIYNGIDSGIDCVKIYVSKRLAESDLVPCDLVPKEFLGIPTDVVEIGCAFSPQPRVPQSWRFKNGGEIQSPRLSVSPVPKVPRSSVNPSLSGTAGVLLVDDQNPPEYYILGCNHTIAANGRIPAGSKLIEAGKPDVTVATVVENGFVPMRHGAPNYVDCAIARISPGYNPKGLLVPPIRYDSAVIPSRRMQVSKHGGATATTHGQIVDVDADIFVEYSFGTFLFSHQILVQSNGQDRQPFAIDGDSGAPVFNEEGVLIGLVFAPAGRLTAVCPISRIVTELKKAMGADFHLSLALGGSAEVTTEPKTT